MATGRVGCYLVAEYSTLPVTQGRFRVLARAGAGCLRCATVAVWFPPSIADEGVHHSRLAAGVGVAGQRQVGRRPGKAG